MFSFIGKVLNVERMHRELNINQRPGFEVQISLRVFLQIKMFTLTND